MFQSTHLHEVRPFTEFRSEALKVFQSTHLHEVRLIRPCSYTNRVSGFNPRTYTRCDNEVTAARLFNCLFQSTHLHEVRPFSSMRKTDLKRVSIHAPTRGATIHRIDVAKVISVSIHAPTRGATKMQLLAVEPGMVSIHAPTRGATAYSGISAIIQLCFNPRTYTRCDDDMLTSSIQGQTVSIHAPTRGATIENKSKLQELQQFQSTHLHEVRRALL